MRLDALASAIGGIQRLLAKLNEFRPQQALDALQPRFAARLHTGYLVGQVRPQQRFQPWIGPDGRRCRRAPQQEHGSDQQGEQLKAEQGSDHFVFPSLAA